MFGLEIRVQSILGPQNLEAADWRDGRVHRGALQGLLAEPASTVDVGEG